MKATIFGREVLIAQRCPVCSYIMDRAQGVGEDVEPRPGDVTVCLNSGCILTFQEDLSLRQTTVEENEALLDSNREAYQMLHVISAKCKHLKRERGGKNLWEVRK